MNPLKGKKIKKFLTRAPKSLKGLNPKFKNFGSNISILKENYKLQPIGQKFRSFWLILKRKVTNGSMTT